MKVLVLSSAEDDLRSGFEFFEKRQSGVGVYFLQCIFRDIDALEVEAGIHRVLDGYHRRLSDRFPHAIYYTVDADTVRVWRILDLDATQPGFDASCGDNGEAVMSEVSRYR